MEHISVPTANNQILEPQDSPYEIIESSKMQRVFTVYLSKEIGAPSEYVDLISKLRTAIPSDVFYIHLNTPGGYVDTGVQIINAMKDCPARVITVLDGTVCSMGALIFLASSEYIIHDNCRLMFHNYSGGTYGKGNEQIAQLASTVEWYTHMFSEICTPFLNEEEVAQIIGGTDLWLNSDEVSERMNAVVAVMEQEAVKAQDEIDQEAEAEILERRKLAREIEKETKRLEREAKQAAKPKAKKPKKAKVKKPKSEPTDK